MSTKKVKYTKSSIKDLPNNKPVLYRIETENGGLIAPATKHANLSCCISD